MRYLFPGVYLFAIAAGRGPQFHLRVSSHFAGPRDQQEQFAADLLAGARIRAPVPAHQVVGDPGPRGPALQLRGQRQGGLAERHAVQRRCGPGRLCLGVLAEIRGQPAALPWWPR
jgi:hypothetical protein